EHLDRLLEQPEPVGAALGQPGHPQGPAERARRPPHAGELDLLAGEPSGLVPIAELKMGCRSLRAPGHEGRIATADGLEATTGRQRLLQPAREVTAEDPE